MQPRKILITQKFRLYILITLVLLATLCLTSGKPVLVSAQESDQELEAAVEAVFEALTPEERVGQLFMVSFKGSNVNANSDIAELIRRYRVGEIGRAHV